MANNKRTMPMFVIDNYSALDDNQELFQKTILFKSKVFPRSLSLINYGEVYKDLSGNIHYSSLNRLKNFFIRSNSCPNNKLYDIQSSLSSTTTAANGHCEMNLLDPFNGTYSPAGSSSRYSLYGSFFDLSEHGCHSSFLKNEKKFLTIDGRPLLITDKNPNLKMNTYQDKCKDWLNHLDTM